MQVPDLSHPASQTPGRAFGFTHAPEPSQEGERIIENQPCAVTRSIVKS